jgi:uncharacterized protein
MWTLIFLAALAIPTHTGYVTDIPNVLSLAQRSSLEAKLEEYEKSSTNEIAVLIIPTLQSEDLNDFANRVFHTWGIGKKGADNGVLLLWSTGDRKVRIEVGYGLESSLPDGRAGEIIRSAIIPAFRKAEWNSGLTAGINEIILATSAAPKAPRSSSRLWIWLLLTSGVVLIIAGIVIQTKRLEREAEAQEERQRRRDADEYTAARRVSRLPYTPPAVLPLTERRRSSSSSSPIIIAPVPIPEPESESRSSSSSSPSEESPSSSSSSFGGFDSGSGSDSGSFGGGDSGGGGASGSY